MNYYNKTNQPTSTPALVLGSGYSSDKQMATYLNCFNNGTIAYDGDAKSTIFFSDAISFAEFQKDLNIDVSESGSIGLFSEDISATYARHIKDDTYTQSFYYSEKVTLPTKIFNPAGYGTDSLTDPGKKIYQAGVDQFRDVCGDQLVQQNHLGAGLYVTLRLQFNSLYDKSTFTAHAGAKFGSMINVSGTISQVVSQYHIKGSLEVSALQVGGDVTQLAKIFTIGPNPYAITECGLDNMPKCQQSINGVLAYAANEFPSQIDFKEGKVNGSAASIGYTFMPLTQLGLKVGASVITPEIEAARELLGGIYSQTQDKESFTNHILHSPIFNAFPEDIKAKLSTVENSLLFNLKVLENPDSGAIACYSQPTACIDIAKSINSKLKNIDDNTINTVKNSYNFIVTLTKITELDGKQSSSQVIGAGSAIAIPTDNQGNYQWNYLGNMNNLKIIKNNDNTISLNVNGGQYGETPGDGQYNIHVNCPNPNFPIPHPFNSNCIDQHTQVGPDWDHHDLHIYTVGDMTLQSISEMY